MLNEKRHGVRFRHTIVKEQKSWLGLLRPQCRLLFRFTKLLGPISISGSFSKRPHRSKLTKINRKDRQGLDSREERVL